MIQIFQNLIICLIAAGCLLSTANAKPAKNAWVMRFDGDWEVASGLPEKAMLISLQGLANRNEAQIYIVHPPDFQWEITEPLYDFYKRKHGISFSEIKTAKAALSRFKSAAKGYVVWDKSIGATLNAAFTICGLEDAIVVSEELIPLVKKEGHETHRRSARPLYGSNRRRNLWRCD